MIGRSNCLLVLLATALVAGCGGGGGAAVPPDAAAPQVAIAFPPAESATDLETIVVDGTASDDVAVAGVTVNGVQATSDDGFRTWRATVPVARGANGLLAEARDAAGNAASDASSVERIDPIFVNPKGIALDDGRALVVDGNRLIAVDLATGGRAVLPLSGTPLANANRIALDDLGRYAFVGGSDSIYRVELDTGATVVLTGGGFGAGPFFSGVEGIRFDGASGDVIAMSPGSRVTFRVDVASGNRTMLVLPVRATTDFVIDLPRNRLIAGTRYLSAHDLDTLAETPLSNPTVGTGPDLGLAITGMALDEASLALYGAAQGEETSVVVAWDLVTGDRRYVSGDGLGTGPDLLNPRAIAFDAPRGRLLVVDAGLDALVAVDVATGDRSVASGFSKGAGPPLIAVRDLTAAPDGRLFVLRSDGSILLLEGADRSVLPAVSGVKVTAPRSLLFDDASGRLVMSDLGGNVLVKNPLTGLYEVDVRPPALFSIDPSSGAAFVLSDATHGGGPEFVDPDRIALDGGGALVMDPQSKAILRVDLASGDRTIVSNRLVGAGDEFQQITAVDVDVATGRALVSDVWVGIVAIDLLTGDRARLSSTRPNVADLAVDATGRRAFVANDTQLLRVDLDAGAASTLNGRGPRITNPQAVAYDAARGVVLAGDPGTASIVAISPATAERVILAK